MLAVAQDGGAVGDAEDLVHAVRDVDDGDALAAKLADIVEQALDLVLGQRRGRLVEHQHLAGLRCRLDDLGQLPVTGRDIGDLGGRVDVDAHAGEELSRLGDRRRVVDQAGAGS